MEKKPNILDLGTLQGDLLVFGGVYSNLQALERMMEIAEEKGFAPENVVCTGDVVGYCAQPQECLEAVRDWGIHVVAGNVEIQLRDDSDICGCNFEEGSRCDGFSQLWYPYAKLHVDPAIYPWLAGLPDHIRFEYGGRSFYVLHGAVEDTSGFVFRSTPWAEKKAQLEAVGAEVILGGHCGLPFNDVQGREAWLNPGVIGMPANDGTTRVWYMILKENEFGPYFSHHHFEYDHVTAADLMRKNHLPPEYAHTLETGIWDNCEILPTAETREQGIKLEFEPEFLEA